MKDYRDLSDFDKKRIDKLIVENIEPKKHKNKRTGFEWIEPDSTLLEVHSGKYCAECWRIFYNCLCSHDS